MTSFKSGLVSVSFRNLSVEEILKLMKENNLTYVEWGSDVHAPQNDTKRLKEIYELQIKYNIKCSSYGTYFRIGVNKPEEIYDYINGAKLLGTNVLRLWCGDKSPKLLKEDEKERIIAESKILAEIAQNEGVILCMECHNHTFTEDIESALYLMESVNSDSFRMYYQPNQFKTEEINLEYARLIAPYTVNIHIFNWKDKDKFPLKDATDIWKKYLSCFKGDIKLLLEFMPDGSPNSLPSEVKALNIIMGGIK